MCVEPVTGTRARDGGDAMGGCASCAAPRERARGEKGPSSQEQEVACRNAAGVRSLSWPGRSIPVTSPSRAGDCGTAFFVTAGRCPRRVGQM